jgi:IS30 family transposase
MAKTIRRTSVVILLTLQEKRTRLTLARRLLKPRMPLLQPKPRPSPQKTSLGGYTDADIDDVICNLNATPRKCLGDQTPIEAFAAKLGVALEI